VGHIKGEIFMEDALPFEAQQTLSSLLEDIAMVSSAMSNMPYTDAEQVVQLIDDKYEMVLGFKLPFREKGSTYRKDVHDDMLTQECYVLAKPRTRTPYRFDVVEKLTKVHPTAMATKASSIC
jgi:hypothetical protein